MDESPYSFSAQPIEVRYDFESVSDVKTVKKSVKFTETSLPGVFNIALLDLLDDGSESDLSVTDNEDLRTVLATVMKIIDNFLAKFPSKIVTFRGNDDRRTRLYRIVVSRELELIRQRYIVLGGIGDNHFEVFQPNVNYDSFFVLLKQEETLMEETENTLRTDAPANAELIESKQLSPSQRKLAEVNAHFARTDMSKLFELIKDVRAKEEAKLQS